MERFLGAPRRRPRAGRRGRRCPASAGAPGWFARPSVHLVASSGAARVALPARGAVRPGPGVYPVRDIDDALPLCDGTELRPVRRPVRRDAACAGGASPRRSAPASLFWNRGTSAPSGLMPFGGEKRAAAAAAAAPTPSCGLRREVSLLGAHLRAPSRPLPGTELVPRRGRPPEMKPAMSELRMTQTISRSASGSSPSSGSTPS